jgi:putative membrane protein
MCAFVLATMYFIRGINTAVPETFAGILEKNEVEDLFHRSDHLPLRAADIVRVGLKKLFTISDDTPFGVAQYRTQQMILLEKQLNDMMMQEGAMERIKSTPLPLVYVTHLRTWLLIFLLAMPYLWQPSLGYITVPVVVLTGFALLGLEGAAQEMEAPFSKDRTGHLNMDAFCLTLLSNIQQQMQEDAERLLHSSLSSYQANLSSDGKMNPQHLEVIDERRNQSA